MPRKGPVVKSPVVSDPVYNSPVVTALINRVLLHGKRSTAESIVYDALEGCRKKTEVDPLITLKRWRFCRWICRSPVVCSQWRCLWNRLICT